MKSLIISLAILSSVIVTTILSAVYTDKLLGELEDTVLDLCEDGCDESNGKISKIENEYDRIKTYLILFSRQNDVQRIEEYISDIKSSHNSGDTDGLISAKSRLLLHVRQQRRLSRLGIEAIF